MFMKSLAMTSVVVLLVGPFAANAEKPSQVTIVDPVVPVEVLNSDPIPVTVLSLPPEERYQISQLFDTWAPLPDGTSFRSFSGG